MRRAVLILAAVVSLAPQQAGACIDGAGRGGYLSIPKAMFDIECRGILGDDKPWDFDWKEGTSSGEKFDRTVEVDLEEIAAATKDCPDAELIVKNYTTMRLALKQHVAPWLSRVFDARRNDARAKYFGFPNQQGIPARPEPFDAAPYEDTLASLPAEFRHYVLGAVSYHAGNWEQAIEEFRAVLRLPEDERQYRSTWAAFMVGKAYIEFEPVKAAEYFELTRSLANSGFHDALDLAAASVGWQAYCELEAGDYLNAMHRYAESGPSASDSLRVVCRRILSADTVDPAIVRDDLARKIVTVWLIAGPRHGSAEKWLDALDHYHPDGIVEHADRLAWFSYQQGAMDVAERWLDHCDPQAPYGRWVRAKLLLRAGDLEEGTALLKTLANDLPDDHQWRVQSPIHESWWTPTYARDEVRMDLGLSLIEREDYVGALEAFCSAPNPNSATYVAERLLTLEELIDYVESPPENLTPNRTDRFMPMYGGYSGPPDLKNLLARRLAREGRWDEAIQYFSDNTRLRRLAFDVKEHLAISEDDNRSAEERAHSLFELGRIFREDGPQLFSPAIVPNRPQNTNYVPTTDTEQRNWDSQACYPRMNYYRYLAADYMWRAAELLPDNDVMTAQALYLGGTYLKAKDPAAADPFYKALVRRNPNLLIAQQADDLRWFPSEFTDVVLYQPMPEPHWYERKRNVAIVMLAYACAALAVWYLGRRLYSRQTVTPGRP